jgi:DNA recombination protein RmuC
VRESEYELIVGLVVGLVLGAGGGVLVACLVSSSRAGARMSAERALHESRSAADRAEIASLTTALDHERKASAERLAAVEDVRRQLVGEFAELSRKALDQNSTQFLALADAKLNEAQNFARGELDQRRQAIEQLLAPLKDQFSKYESAIRLLELERQKAYSGLTEQVSQLTQSQDKLRQETKNLVTALRSPSTRGRWGEMQLRRVVEMAGMLEHCDFEEQSTLRTADGVMRPDLVVRLPGSRHVVVDAKVPLQGFLDANEAADEQTRKLHLHSHARQLRAHVDALSKKAYWAQFEESPEFVVAFVPGDALLTAALEEDADLMEHAVGNRVLLATPTTLIALLRAVAYGWRSEALAENAREVQRIGRELYKRLGVFGEHMARTGRGLRSAVDSYNKAVGSLERSVLPQARRFSELGVVAEPESEALEIDQVDASLRELQAPELSSRPPALELVEILEEDDAEDLAEGFPDAARG